MNGSRTLAAGSDYTVSGSVVTISHAYLASLPAGAAQLTFQFSGDFESDIHYTANDGDSFTYSFQGTGAELFMPTSPELGTADIYVDGELKATADAHGDSRGVQHSVFSIQNLPPGSHTIKAVKKSGSLMMVDKLVYTVAEHQAADPTPTPTQTPTPTTEPTATPTATLSPSSPVEPTDSPALPTASPSATASPVPSATPAQPHEHSAYLKGYGNGLFKPDKEITRAEMATILSRVITRQTVSNGPHFTDVNSSHWAAKAISQTAAMGLMKGYPDGKFRPEQPITRAEAAKVISLLTTAPQVKGAGYTDTTGNWAEADIRIAQGAGILRGYTDGSFHPSASLTRAEAAAVVNRLLGRGPLYGVETSPYRDVSVNYWAFGDIVEASTDHLFLPRDGGGELQIKS